MRRGERTNGSQLINAFSLTTAKPRSTAWLLPLPLPRRPSGSDLGSIPGAWVSCRWRVLRLVLAFRLRAGAGGWPAGAVGVRYRGGLVGPRAGRAAALTGRRHRQAGRPAEAIVRMFIVSPSRGSGRIRPAPAGVRGRRRALWSAAWPVHPLVTPRRWHVPSRPGSGAHAEGSGARNLDGTSPWCECAAAVKRQVSGLQGGEGG